MQLRGEKMKSNSGFIKLSTIILLNIFLLAPLVDKDDEPIYLSTNIYVYIDLV